LTSWFVAQAAKAVIEVFKHKASNMRQFFIALFWKTGGMPSSHSATVMALTTAVAFADGISSHLFIVSLFFSILTIRDALGVRRSAGIQATALNRLSRDLQQKIDINPTIVKEIHGHKTSEVLFGILLGFLVTIAVFSLS
jgi:hypothetical protein